MNGRDFSHGEKILYIRHKEKSRSENHLPIQFDEEILKCDILSIFFLP
jgi:hypothetical protein